MRFAPQAIARPRWLLDFALDGFSMDLALSNGLGAPDAPMSSDEAVVSWVLSPITDAFDGLVIAKGVLSRADARLAVDAGASSVVVSNHGGRQLDGVTATLAALHRIVDEVGGEVETFSTVECGGARTSKAIALGARAVLIGRPWAFGLGVAG